MTDLSERIERAAALMLGFAERTGLGSEREPRRYLWTDAFALCNFLALARATGEPRYGDLARRLVENVHHVLGRQRPDSQRSGWLSRLDEAQGEAHPTRGGLRIGKALPERGASEPFDEHLEWERDGQYFHYLTKWMHALDQMARATRERRFSHWACELASAAHAAFTRDAPGGHGRRMVWKMSCDLSRVLVTSMGHHDPLDGYITCVELRSTAVMLGDEAAPRLLDTAIGDFAAMIADRDWTTADPLGIGGLLADAHRVAQLSRRGEFTYPTLLDSLLVAAHAGLAQYVRRGELRQPAAYRLAFRELGLAIGLAAVSRIDVAASVHVAALGRHAAIGEEIERFWLDAGHRRADTWLEHLDINDVMLATSLVPDGFLELS